MRALAFCVRRRADTQLHSPDQVPQALLGSPKMLCIAFNAYASATNATVGADHALPIRFQENFPPNLVPAKAAVLEILSWLLAPAMVELGC